MFLSIDNPVYNTMIVFSIIMILVYMTKPDVIYDNEKHEFRQFGTTDGKTLLPIYIVGILLATILYVFFYYLAQLITYLTMKIKALAGTCHSLVSSPSLYT